MDVETTLTVGMTRDGAPRAVWRIWLAMFVLALVLYAATARRGAQWQDSGSHILRAVTGELHHPLGLALVHPLHHWLARAFVLVLPVEPGYAVTLVSALAAAVAVANVFGCVLFLTNRREPAIIAAASLAMAHTFWQMATIAETYTLAAALLSAECWCLIALSATRRRVFLWAMLAFNGLGVSNHMLAALTTPVVGVVAIVAWRRRWIGLGDAAVGCLCWLIGSLPYSALIVQQWMQSGDLGNTIRSALFGKVFADEVLHAGVNGSLFRYALPFVAISFPNLFLPAAAVGVGRAKSRNVPALTRRALLASLVLHAVFVLRYDVLDRHYFFAPMYVLLALFAGIGFASLFDRKSRRSAAIIRTVTIALLALTPVVYAILPRVARSRNVLGEMERHKPYRDDYAYVFLPWSIADESADRMSRYAVALAGANGVILVEDSMAEYAVMYQRVRAGLTGVEITGDINPERLRRAVLEGRRVVLVPRHVGELRIEAPVGRWQREGDLYLLDPAGQR